VVLLGEDEIKKPKTKIPTIYGSGDGIFKIRTSNFYSPAIGHCNGPTAEERGNFKQEQASFTHLEFVNLG
jgi:hypothetical protein